MPIGKLKRLVHLSQQRHLPNTRLISDRNDKGYGFIDGIDGPDVYFSHDVVKNRFGFDDLRKGQLREYALENGPYVRAATVRLAPVNPASAPTLP